MQHIVPALAFVGVLLALVSAIDRIMEKETKKALGVSIKTRITGRRYDLVEVQNPVSFIERIRPFSLRSASVSAQLSILSLCAVVYFQYFFLQYNFSEIVEGVPGENINRFILFFVYMVASNIVVDYLSFTQTLVIIRLINKTDSKRSLFVLLITDLLASINIFTFVYALFLVAGITTFLNFNKPTSFLVSLEASSLTEQGTQTLLQLGVSDADTIRHVSVFRVVSDDGAAELASGYIFSAQEEIRSDTVFPLFKFSLEDGFPYASPTLKREAGKIFPYEEFPSLEVEYVFKGSMSVFVSPPDFLEIWYSVAYLSTDDVQDKFFEVTQFSPGFKEVDPIRYQVLNTMTERSLADTVIYWCPSTQKRISVDDESCDGRVLLISSSIIPLDRKLATQNDVGGKLPLYTFFFTSLAMTSIIYMFYISVYVFKLAWIVAGKLSIPLIRFANFEEHPLTILSLPIIVALGLAYLILVI